MEQVRKIEETLKKEGKQFEVHTYPEAGHGFSCDQRPAHFNPDAAKDAFGKAVGWFKRHLAKAA
jgi:carboxymethylenebutenolidase